MLLTPPQDEHQLFLQHSSASALTLKSSHTRPGPLANSLSWIVQATLRSARHLIRAPRIPVRRGGQT